MTAPTRGQRKPVVLLRPVPGDTVIHRLWAGTKLLSVAGIGVLLTFYPGWVPIGAVAVLVLVTARQAHIPRGALPSIPFFLWILVVLGGALAAGGRRIPVHRHRFGADRSGRVAQLPAHHRAGDCATGSGGIGFLDSNAADALLGSVAYWHRPISAGRLPVCQRSDAFGRRARPRYGCWADFPARRPQTELCLPG